MKLYADKEQYKLYHGNMLDMLETIEKQSIDSIVCDPPYELNFMGKGWDNSGIAFNKEAWSKCYEVLKPGGYLLAFGGTRTYHRIACAIEDAGFEIRDCIMYLYGSGFPKSYNIAKGIESKIINNSANVSDFKKLKGEKTKTSLGLAKADLISGHKNKLYEKTQINVEFQTDLAKKWEGFGTQLKPAYEPIIVARKPFKTSVAENVMQYGVGGINIDECRIATNELKSQFSGKNSLMGGIRQDDKDNSYECIPSELGRFPSNVIHDGSEEAIKDMNINENEASRRNKVDPVSISLTANGKRRKSAGGYIWKFASELDL